MNPSARCVGLYAGGQVEFARLTLAEYPIRPPHKEVAMVHLG